MRRISIEPVGNKLIVLQDPKREETEGGIIIPDSVGDHVNLVRGEIVAVSKDLPELKEGQFILFPSGAGVLQEIDGIKYKFLKHTSGADSHVWAIDHGSKGLEIVK